MAKFSTSIRPRTTPIAATLKSATILRSKGFAIFISLLNPAIYLNKKIKLMKT
ncbi:MAG: hypothetical protein QG624_560 [Pseudomonadota bacterium]|nr:hypothetical protein [Pseudomonadota bacterium]